ncbi:PREDICTED: Fc receptor-like protein 5 [Lipotes vexillifer]|uniref:Fc receptor-like protein 5 n=1 Tax=Lipotes vexillifer TaxID=118797 RepID=A0A340XFV3_LIPVE|nr:PREDICTED: Fc receptor-like protein 5 [Lipotes vexillifer]
MLLWVSLLVLAPVGGQFATEPKSVIFLHSPWTTVFQGENVTLTCKAFHLDASEKIKWYRWYLLGEIQSETSGNTHEVHESGDYRCQAQDSPLSNPVGLLFSPANLILQAPLDVFEKESVILRCRAKANTVLKTIKLYKNGKVLEDHTMEIPVEMLIDFHIHQASLKDNGKYHCTGVKENDQLVSSNSVKIEVQELFPRPVLRASSTQPTEGGEVTLTCETQLSPQRSDVQLQFHFFRDRWSLGSGWRSSPEFCIPTIWRENSGSYWCQAQSMTSSVQKQSQRLQIQMFHQFIRELKFSQTMDGPQSSTTFSPVPRNKPNSTPGQLPIGSADLALPILRLFFYDSFCDTPIPRTPHVIFIHLEVVPDIRIYSRPKLVFEGQELVLICSVNGVPGPITVSWYRKFNLRTERKLHTSSKTEFKIPVVQNSNDGEYYCVASNSRFSFRSDTVTINVKVPVSQPVLTLSPPGTRTFVGDEVSFDCEAQRGSLPIWYQFFREGVLLRKIEATLRRTMSYRFSLTEEHSGNYYCTADNGLGLQSSETLRLSVTVPVSRPVLTLRAPGTQAMVGDVMELHCETWRGSPPILYQFYHEDVCLGSSSSPSRRGASFNLLLTAEHSGNYFCEANNGQGFQRSNTVSLSVRVPVSHPVLTLRASRAQAMEGDMVELHCEAQRGSPPVLYQFYHEDVAVGNSSAPLGGGASFNLSLTTKHSGNYSCKADNGLGVQQSEVMLLSVIVPVSRPILTLRAPRAQAVVGDVVELHCESQRGSPPILYQFYHKNVTLESSMSHSGQGVSLNLSLTANHSGTYSCEADNGLGPQCSEAVTLSITGLTGSRSGPVATGVTGGLLSTMGLAAIALLFYCWLPRKTGRKPTFDSSRNPSASEPQEPTYHNVPGWIELQPVYSNVNPNKGDVVYSEVRSVKVENKQAGVLRAGGEVLAFTAKFALASAFIGPYSIITVKQLLNCQKDTPEENGGK